MAFRKTILKAISSFRSSSTKSENITATSTTSMATPVSFGTTTEIREQIIVHAQTLLHFVQVPGRTVGVSEELTVSVTRAPPYYVGDRSHENEYVAVVTLHLGSHTNRPNAVIIQSKPCDTMRGALHALLDATCEMMRNTYDANELFLRNQPGATPLGASEGWYLDETPRDTGFAGMLRNA